MRGIEMYKLYAKIEDSLIKDIKTIDFVKDPENWQEIGEQEGRHIRETILNSEGIPLFKIVNGKKTKRTNTEVTADIDALNAQMDADRKDITKAMPIVKALALVVADLTGKTPTEIKNLVKDKMNA